MTFLLMFVRGILSFPIYQVIWCNQVCLFNSLKLLSTLYLFWVSLKSDSNTHQNEYSGVVVSSTRYTASKTQRTFLVVEVKRYNTGSFTFLAYFKPLDPQNLTNVEGPKTTSVYFPFNRDDFSYQGTQKTCHFLFTRTDLYYFINKVYQSDLFFRISQWSKSLPNLI